MPTSKWLQLALAFHEKLNEELPALVAEINLMDEGSLYPIVLPAPDADGNSVELDVDPGLIDGKFTDFPRIQVGVFARTADEELEADVDYLSFPYTVEIYIAARSKKEVFVQAVKWGIVLDLFFERFREDIHPNFRTRASTDADITFSLPKGNGGTSRYYTKLISAVGEFNTYE